MTTLELRTSVPPRFHFVPPHSESAGQECVDLAAYAGLELDPWQVDVIMGALSLDDDERWAALRVVLLVPRQNGKGGILEALELYHLFAVPTTSLITHTAHRFDTCLDHFRRLRDLIVDTPALLARVDATGRRRKDGLPSGIKDSNGNESITLADGAKIGFKARENQGSGRGFSGDLVVFDEAFWLGDLSGLIPTLSARENPQVWYTSSAPLPRNESNNLRRLIREGRARAEGENPERGASIAYFEWSRPAGIDVDDWDEVVAANPSTEVGRITPRYTYEVERFELGEDAFPRERFGIFPDPKDDAPTWEVVDEQQWESCASEVVPGWLGDPPTFAVEFTVDRTAASIGAAGAHPDGGVSIELVERREGVDWVIPRLIELTEHKPKAILIDPKSQAGSLIRDLELVKEASPGRTWDLTLTEVPFIDYARACGTMVDAIVEGTVHHHHQDELDAAVAWAKKRNYGEVWVLDRRSPVDVTPWAVVTLARWGHLEIAAPPARSIYETRGMEVVG